MNIELLEIRDFLKICSPLQYLSDDELNNIVDSIEISYQRVGKVVLSIGQESDALYLIRTGAVSLLDENQKLITKLDEKNWFGYEALLQGKMPHSVKTIEDCLIYAIAADKFRQLISKYPDISNYFSEFKPIRLRQAILDYRGDSQTQLISSKVEDIKLRTSILIPPNLSIIATAQLMASENRSSILVINEYNNLIGIVTEKEFCKRVVAKGLDTDLAIETVMTANPIVVPASMSASAALLTMAKHNIHHLPFKRKQNQYSTITASDIIQFQSHNPLFLISDIFGSTSIEELILHSKKLPSLLLDLVRSSLTAYDIGHLISSIGESITQQLIKLAEKQFGAAPIDYAFVVAGSMARMDQTAQSDQDNAIILSDNYDAKQHLEYFQKLAKFVSDGLHQCGYIYCPGNIMATNPDYCITLSAWKNNFTKWINEPDGAALLNVTVFFDLRCLYGSKDLLDELQSFTLNKTKKSSLFLALLAKNALQFSPPLGLFRQFILEDDGTENKGMCLKRRGITPITDLARVYALANGIAELNTKDRLEIANELGDLSKQCKDDLVDALEFISSVRLQHQSNQIEQGISPNNYVEPEQLSSLERRHLKDAFDVVNAMQKFLMQRYH